MEKLLFFDTVSLITIPKLRRSRHIGLKKQIAIVKFIDIINFIRRF